MGFYKECELTIIYLLDIKTNEYFNYYTIINFKGIHSHIDKYKLGLIELNDKYKIGIRQHRLPIDEVKDLFNKLTKSEFHIVNDKINIPEDMKLLPKQLAPKFWDHEPLMINNILKPNYWGDSYIIEFFDGKKEFQSFLSREEINIDLSKVTDRIGNIIFQFPVTLFQITLEAMRNGIDVKLTILKHPNVSEDLKLKIFFKSSVDNVITGLVNDEISLKKAGKVLPLGDHQNIECYISNNENSIIYHSLKINYLIFNNFSLYFGGQAKRVIYDNPNKTISYSIFNNKAPKILPVLGYYHHIINRARDNAILDGNNKDYLICKNGDRSKTLKFILEKINYYIARTKEICLWDPYLSAKDIVDTLPQVKVFPVKPQEFFHPEVLTWKVVCVFFCHDEIDIHFHTNRAGICDSPNFLFQLF